MLARNTQITLEDKHIETRVSSDLVNSLHSPNIVKIPLSETGPRMFDQKCQSIWWKTAAATMPPQLFFQAGYGVIKDMYQWRQKVRGYHQEEFTCTVSLRSVPQLSGNHSTHTHAHTHTPVSSSLFTVYMFRLAWCRKKERNPRSFHFSYVTNGTPKKYLLRFLTTTTTIMMRTTTTTTPPAAAPATSGTFNEGFSSPVDVCTSVVVLRASSVSTQRTMYLVTWWLQM